MAVNRPDFVNQLLEMWGRLEWRQRGVIIAFAVLSLILIVSVVYFMNRVEYQPLYRDLDPEDARAIAAKLTEENRPFRVDGTSILVAAPKEEIDKLRLEIAGAGLGRSGRVGYEIFDKSQFGMTDFTEQINLQRALEGELARTISSLSEIAQARVHIVLPKDSYFEQSREKAKASVVLTLKRGAELSKSSIAGIRGVVAGAVPGLVPTNVSIVDEEGRMLAQSQESNDMARAELEQSVREQMEKDMVGKVVNLLEPLVGHNNVHAKASVVLDFNTMEQTEESYNPNPPAVVSQQRSEERVGGGALAEGVPGTQSNVDAVASSATATTGPTRFKQNEITNYEVSKTIRHTVQPKGSVRRLSVAVILNNRTITTKDKDGNVSSKSEPISEKELTAYRNIVTAAVGFDERRGDVVTLENVAFYDEQAQREDAPAQPWYERVQRQEYFFPALKYLALLVLFLLAYLIFVRPLRKRVFDAIDAVTPQIEAAPEEAQLPAGAVAGELPAATGVDGEGADATSGDNELEDGENVLEMENATDEQIELELMKEANSVEKGNRRSQAIKKRLIDKAKKDPEVMAQLIRSLMKEK